MEITSFEFREGTRFQSGAKTDPIAVGDHLELLRKRCKGELTPRDVVNDARHNNSPLHSFFEWDDHEAAEQHRLSQARGLIKSVVAIYTDNGKSPVKQSAYVHINEPETPHYREMTHALSQEETRQRVLKSAWRDLQGWRRKYKDLQEFAGLIDQIDQVGKELTA